MLKKVLLPALAVLALPITVQAKYIQKSLQEKCAAKDLSFLVTFENKDVNANFAKGDKNSTTMANEGLLLRGLIGFDKRSAFKPEPGEKLRFNVAGNANPHNGTLIFWTAGLDYNPGDVTTDGKKRGNIALAHLVFKEGKRSLEYQLYEFGENIYFDWKSSEPPHSFGNIGRVYASRKGIKKGQWHQIACTWNSKRLAIYLNGKLIKEEAFPEKVAKTLDLKVTNNAESFIGIKSPFYEDTHKWGVGIDDFAIYNRALSALEIRNQYLNLLKNKGDEKIEAYSIAYHGVNTSRNDKLDRVELEFDFAALSPAQQKLLDAGKLKMDYELKSPAGKVKKGSFTFKKSSETRIINGVDTPGKYTLTTKVGKDTIVKEIIRPDLSWVGNGYGDEDEVPALWKDFSVNGRTVKLWNRTYKFGKGPLPVEVTAYGKKLFDKLPKLLIDGKEPVWKAGNIKKETRWVTYTGTGKLGKATINYTTRVEYDGMILLDWTISGEPTISNMKLAWKMAPENHQFLMTPVVNENREAKVSWAYPENSRGSLLWFVSEKKGGFAFTMVNDANWIYNKGEKIFFADKSTGDASVTMITKKVKLPKDTPYRAIFIATPTRPLPVEQRVLKYHDSRGGSKSMISGGGDGGIDGIFHHAPHPTDFEYRHKNRLPNTASVYGGIALTAHEPEAVYFRKYWETPGSYSYNMPWHKPLGNGKYQLERYPSLSTCTSLIVNDFFLNAQHKLYNHKLADRVWQVYYDLCGNSTCTNKLHGCRYTDKFGREVNSYEVLFSRDLIRRTVAYAHKHGKTVMLHGQRSYFPMIQGMADYWFPGEQYNGLLRRNPFGYADEVPDAVYRSEFNKNVLGVGVIHLPALGQADRSFHGVPAYTEAMMAMLQSHDVETTSLWASSKVCQKVWDALEKYDVQSPETVCRLYHEQNEVKCSNPDIRITYYKTPGDKYVLFIVNKTYRGRKATFDINALVKNKNFKAVEEYKGKDVQVKDGKFTISVPARSFRIVCFPPVPTYPQYFNMNKIWSTWKNKNSDTVFRIAPKEGIGNSAALKIIFKKTGSGLFSKSFPIIHGKTYTMSVMVKQNVKGNKITLTARGRESAKQLRVQKIASVVSDGEWQKISLTFTVPADGIWKQADNIFVMLSSNGKNCETLFDDFRIDEK